MLRELAPHERSYVLGSTWTTGPLCLAGWIGMLALSVVGYGGKGLFASLAASVFCAGLVWVVSMLVCRLTMVGMANLLRDSRGMLVGSLMRMDGWDALSDEEKQAAWERVHDCATRAVGRRSEADELRP